MDCYHVFGGQIYLEQYGHSNRKRLPVQLRDGNFVVTHERICQPYLHIDKDVVIYDSCYQCKPVIYVNGCKSPSTDEIADRHPWNEWRLTIDKGKLVEVKRRATSQTYEDVLNEVRQQGLRVLAEDDPIAVRHLERRKDRGFDW